MDQFGIILRKCDREALFRPIPRETRTWGDEVFEVGDQKFSAPGMSEVGIQFDVCSMGRGYLMEKLPPAEQVESLEYVSITGPGVIDYEEWAVQAGPEAAPGAFEQALLGLLGQLGFWAFLLVPSTDDLREFINVSVAGLAPPLRRHMGALWKSRGMLAIGVQQGL